MELDINCDLGEGLGSDVSLMPYLDSCNIACGGHAGDQESITNSIRLAKIFEVKVGAHPSYPDKLHFGRKVLDMPLNQIKLSIIRQVQFFEKICKEENYTMNHIKPHGALYNELAKSVDLALVICDLIEENFPGRTLYCPPHSVIQQMASSRNIPVKIEAFADRNYNPDYSLVDRNHPNAVLTDPDDVLEHVYLIAKEKKVRSISGAFLSLHADTLCVHGDNPNALTILKAIRKNIKT
jgi:UPF0271 protein